MRFGGGPKSRCRRTRNVMGPNWGNLSGGKWGEIKRKAYRIRERGGGGDKNLAKGNDGELWEPTAK